MNVEFKCKNCGQLLAADEKHTGEKAKCPKCEVESIIPPVELKRSEKEDDKFPEIHGEPKIAESEDKNKILEDSKLVTCQECGKPVSPRAIICKHCGSRLHITSEVLQKATEKGSDGKSFLGALFDFSFTDFIVPKIIKFLYILSIIGAAIGTVVLVMPGFYNYGHRFGIHIDRDLRVILLVAAPLIFLLSVIIDRIIYEIIIVIFRIAEHTGKIAQQGQTKKEQ